MVDLSCIQMTPSAELKSVMFVNFNKTLMVDQYLVIHHIVMFLFIHAMATPLPHSPPPSTLTT